jgi:hypothetical protein
MSKSITENSKKKPITRSTSYAATRDSSQLRKFLSEEEVSLYISCNLLDVLCLLELISNETYWKAVKVIEHNKIRYYQHKIMKRRS